jgi:hypothetical protein
MPHPEIPRHTSLHGIVLQNEIKRWLQNSFVTRYSTALTDLQGAANDAARRNAELRMQGQALSQGSMLFEDIHSSVVKRLVHRVLVTTDFYNYRWQAGKKYGTVPALRKMHDYYQAYKAGDNETYGIELTTRALTSSGYIPSKGVKDLENQLQ